MSRTSERATAGVIAVFAIAAMIWWPDADAPRLVIVESAEVPDTVAIAETDPPSANTVEHPNDPPDPAPVPVAQSFDPPPVRDASGTDAEFEATGRLADGSGTGIRSAVNFAPGIRFPIEIAQAFANSQIWSTGGFYGPEGQQCAPENYAYPWRDTFCEDGGAGAPICPASGSHMGQDFRPATCQEDTYWAVAASDGVITSVGTYSVRLMSADGLRFTYLHLAPSSLTVETGDRVTSGQRLGRISNAYGGTPATMHLHFEIRAAFVAGEAGLIAVPVPPYTAMVDAYARLASETDGGEES